MTTIEYSIDLNNTTGYANSTSYADLLVDRRPCVLIDTSKFVNPKIYFEATLVAPAAGNISYARLVSQGTSDDASSAVSEVAGSELSHDTTTYTKYRSGALTITSGHRFRVQIKNTTASTSIILRAAKIIIIDDISAGWSKGEESIDIGAPFETTTSTAAVALNYQPKYLHESIKRDGTVTIYFESMLYSSSAGKSVECSLWNETDGTQVTEVATTSSTPVRIRSASISLTNGKVYVVKKRSSSAKTCTVSDARIIIQQNGAITKTQLHKKVGHLSSTTSLTYVTTLWLFYLDKSNYINQVSYYVQSTQRVSVDTITGYLELQNRSDAVSVPNSELTTTSTTWARLRSIALALTDLRDYTSRLKVSAAGTVYHAASFVIIDLVIPTQKKAIARRRLLIS